MRFLTRMCRMCPKTGFSAHVHNRNGPHCIGWPIIWSMRRKSRCIIYFLSRKLFQKVAHAWKLYFVFGFRVSRGICNTTICFIVLRSGRAKKTFSKIICLTYLVCVRWRIRSDSSLMRGSTTPITSSSSRSARSSSCRCTRGAGRRCSTCRTPWTSRRAWALIKG